MSSSLFSSRVSCKRGPLERLRKVVVLEDVIESKRVLESTESSVETILDELAKLKKIHVAFETLAETKIGVAVHRLRKHADSEVKTRAKSLVQLWKSTAATAVATNPHVQQGLRSQLKKRKAGDMVAQGGAVAAVAAAAPAKKRTYAELERALYFAEKQIRKLKKQVEQLKRANGTSL